jgi:dipeptidyl aminopeptidase/acylaminoacyl peptidase
VVPRGRSAESGQGRAGSRVAGALLWVLLGLLAAPAFAAKRITGAELPRLRADQGILAVAVDTPVALDLLQLRGGRGISSRVELASVEPGRALALFVVSAGQYRWERVRGADGVQYDVGDDVEYRFDVRPGAINYPGDLVFQPQGGRAAVLHVANRALGVIDALDLRHPGWSLRLPLSYQGRYPDPFPGFYAEARRALGDLPPPQSVLDAPPAGELPLAIDALWRTPDLERISLGPAGDLLTMVVHEPGHGWRLELMALDGSASQELLRSPVPIRAVGWSGDRRIVVSVATRSPEEAVSIFVLDDAGSDGIPRFERLSVPRLGRVLDLLPQHEDALLFATREQGTLAVHRIDIGSQAALDAAAFDWRDRLNQGVDGDLPWLADSRGRLRAVQAADASGANVLYHGTGDRFAEVLRVEDEHGFQPVALSADGSLIYGLSEAQRAQREIVALDPRSGAVTTVFGKSGVDIVAPVFDLDRQLLGASYFEGGHFVTHWFDPADRALDAMLRTRFPERSIALLDRDRSGRHLVIAVEGPDAPAELHHVDRDTGAVNLIAATRPWLQQGRFAPAHLLRTTSRDGLEIEAYLTLPPGDGPRPLVVMPHGGPIGLRNQRTFDPEAQFIASLGYAVLQVNFRGSAGFGRAFREAGHRQLGRLIEDDIDAAIQAALAAYPLDAQRMCMVGASYGGYSSMMAALRWPQRFRCVASMAGFSDRVLQFTASDSGRTADVRALLETFMGSPHHALDDMLSSSPLYRFRELDVPLLLAHGTEDFRVDYEHTRRLVRMLTLAGRAPTLVTLYGEGHAMDSPHNRERLWRSLAGFLRQYLDAPAEQLTQH